MITLHQLNSFCEIVKEGSFRAASEKLYISQPSISQHIACLEKHFGISLFHRKGRKIQLTPEGRYLYASSREILEKVDSITERFHDMRNLHSGNLSIGCSCFTGTRILPPVLEIFQKQFPRIDVDINSGPCDKILQHLENAEIEMAIMGKNLNIPDRNDHIYHSIGRDRIVFVAKPSLTGGKKLNECENSTFITFFDNNPLSIYFKDFKMRNKISFSEKITVEDMEIAKKLACEGLGICFLSSLAIKEELKKGQLEIIETDDDNTLMWDIRTIYNKTRGLSYAGWEMLKILQRETPNLFQ
jgi:DNA-binding transcriptional LysR family regulator